MRIESTALTFQSGNANITRTFFRNNKNLTSKIKNDVANFNKKVFNKQHLKRELIRITEVFFDPKC